MSAPLSNADLVSLSSIGTSMIGFMKSQIPQTLIYGFYVAVFSCCVYAHRNLGSLSRPRLAIFAVTVLMFLATSIEFWINLAGIVVQINTYLVDKSRPVLSSRVKAISAVTKPYSIAENWFTPFNFICSDLIVTWRAWSLCPDSRRKMMIIPYFFLFLTIVTGIMYGAFGSIIYNTPSNRKLLLAYADSQLAHLIFSMLTNASATFIIWKKAWELRRNAAPVSSYTTSVRRSLSAENIVTLLVESGFVYCFLQAIAVVFECVLHYSGVKPAIFGPVVEGYLSSLFIISALYPTMIVVIVAVHRSFTEAASFKSTATTGTASNFTGLKDMHNSSRIKFDDRDEMGIAVTTTTKSVNL